MVAWSWWAWLQIWPNLAASVIWTTPAFVTHHVLIRRHISRATQQRPELPSGTRAR